MDSAYIRALEQRAKWLRWAMEQGAPTTLKTDYRDKTYWRSGLPGYIDTLQSGDTFFMNKKFCSLVEHARETVPDDLAFDSSWMQSPQGWLWIETPFKVPIPADLTAKEKEGLQKIRETIPNYTTRIAAIGWRPINEGQITAKGMQGDVAGRVAGTGAYQFLTFISGMTTDDGFGCWSYFLFQEGDKLIDRIREFEHISVEVGGSYPEEPESNMLHEMRWIYSAFYLMAQRLSMSVQHNTDRGTRRRNEFQKLKVTPFIRVITLRRMEEAREKAGNVGTVDFQWQWEVRGHWRNQWYPSENTHKPVFVDAYIKGPEDKPLKPPGVKLFVAGR